MMWIPEVTPHVALSQDDSTWDLYQIWHLAIHFGTLPIVISGKPFGIRRPGVLQHLASCQKDS